MPLVIFALVSVCLSFAAVCSGAFAHDELFDSQSPTRQPWTTSRVVGSPEPPLALEIEPAFPQLLFNDPMHVRWQPSLQRYFVVELGGKIWSFPHDTEVSQADLVVDLRADVQSFDRDRSTGVREVYSLVFDPDFQNNYFVYVCLIFNSATGETLADGSRISRFTVNPTTPPRIDVATELPILTWQAGGHNGCDLAFDNSGYLLISTGDATDPSPPDRLQVGQDIGNLLSSLLRVDVRGATAEQPYRIPPDNPFVDFPDARPEVWAYGFRNPWRIAVDPRSSEVWVGDVGWEKWEMIHRVQAGGNYGWSVREGFELIQPDAPLGPTPILPPRVALSHSESASITGGVVYRGRELSSVSDHFLFGDWVNGRIWAVPLDSDDPEREVASGPLRIIAFELDRYGQPLVVQHFSPTPLFRLVANPRYESDKLEESTFPQRLSETGLFADTMRQTPSPGVRSFTINHPMWQDGATASYFLGLPNLSQLRVFDAPQPLESIAMFNSRLHYPPGAVLAKTLTWQERPVETQMLHFDGRLWRGYSYVWNAEGSDAELAPATGLEFELPDSNGRRWTVHGRSECLQCHNPWSETTLALKPEQLHRLNTNQAPGNRAVRGDEDSGEPSTWQTLVAQGFIRTLNAAEQEIPATAVAQTPLSHSLSDDLDRRARSYLHVNCAHCHQFGAGTGVALSLRHTDRLKELNCLNTPPEKGRFEIPEGRLVVPGQPARSILLYRMASSTIGRMPHIGSQEIDIEGLSLLAKWIRSPELIQQARDAGLDFELEPELEDSSRSEVELALQEALDRAELVAAGQAMTASEVAEIRAKVDSGTPLVGSLWEGFLPSSARQRRLSPQATYADISSLVGDVDRGRALFRDVHRLQCSRCHRLHEAGVAQADETTPAAGVVGPDLTDIGWRLNAVQLFEAIADPSRQIDARYQGYSILKLDGTIETGILESETEGELVLRTATGEQKSIALEDIELRQAMSQSLMPSGLAQQLTAQEMADLIAFLASVKGKGK